MRKLLSQLVEERQSPCITITMPLMASANHAQENQRRLENILVDIESKLGSFGLSSKGASQLLGPVKLFLEDQLRFPQGSQGLAIFVAPSFAERAYLPQSVEESVTIGQRFRIAPLLPLLRKPVHYAVLAVSEKHARFIVAHEGKVVEGKPEGMPQSKDEAWTGMERQEKSLQFHGGGRGGEGGAIFHGQGGAKDQDKIEMQEYLRKIGKSIEPILDAEHLPLVFAGIEENLGIYRKVAPVQHLLEEYVRGNPDNASIEELAKRAEPIVEKSLQGQFDDHLERYGTIMGTGKTSSDLGAILESCARGKVDTLFLREDAMQWGFFDPPSGTIGMHNRQEEGDEDLLSIAAIHTLRHRGEVLTFPEDRMPEGAIAAAILRL